MAHKKLTFTEIMREQNLLVRFAKLNGFDRVFIADSMKRTITEQDGQTNEVLSTRQY